MWLHSGKADGVGYISKGRRNEARERVNDSGLTERDDATPYCDQELNTGQICSWQQTLPQPAALGTPLISLQSRALLWCRGTRRGQTTVILRVPKRKSYESNSF